MITFIVTMNYIIIKFTITVKYASSFLKKINDFKLRTLKSKNLRRCLRGCQCRCCKPASVQKRVWNPREQLRAVRSCIIWKKEEGKTTFRNSRVFKMTFSSCKIPVYAEIFHLSWAKYWDSTFSHPVILRGNIWYFPWCFKKKI